MTRSPNSSKRSLTKQGLKFKLGSKVTKAETTDSGVTLTVGSRQKAARPRPFRPISCWSALAGGPLVEGLGLDKVGVKLTAHGRIAVDAHLQTSVPGIYAIGDVIDGPMLAHKASEDGNRLRRDHRRPERPRRLGPRSLGHLHAARGGVGRQDRGTVEDRGRCLQGRQVSVHRRSAQPRQCRDGGFREGAGRQGDRQGSGCAHHRRRRPAP